MGACLLSVSASAQLSKFSGTHIGQGEAISGSAELAKPAKGDGIIIGLGERNPLVPPFCETFDDYPPSTGAEEFSRFFEVIDANNDGRDWRFYNYSDATRSKCAYLLYPIDKSTADDWLIPRAIKLVEGKFYNVYMDASLFTDGTEHKFEVKMGYYNDVEGMEFNVIPLTTVNSSKRKRVYGWFQAPESGIFYMGIHAVSNRDAASSGYLFIDNIGIEAARSGDEPQNVSDITFLNDADGGNNCLISFTAPDKALNGSALTGTVDITIKREGKIITTLKGIKPGAKTTYTDTVDEIGQYQYTFMASNAAGDGGEYTTSHFVGVAAPVAPVITSFKEPELGKLSLKWTAPESDVNGNAINTEKVLYNIYDYSTGTAFLLKEKFAGTELTLPVDLIDGEQIATILLLRAVMNNLESEPAVSDIVFVGYPYQLPFINSFTEHEENSFALAVTSDEGVIWRYLDDYSEPKPQDGDNGYACMVATQVGQSGTLSTGKIDFHNANHPYVSFYTFVYPDDANEITVSVVDNDTNEAFTVKKFRLNTLPRTGWQHVILSLADYKDRIVRVQIGARIETHGYVPVDNLIIGDLPTTDMAVNYVTPDQYAEQGGTFNVTVNVSNFGSTPNGNYSVQLIKDGNCVAEKKGVNLSTLEAGDIVVSGSFTAASPEMNTYTVKVVTDNDGNPDNDESAPFTVACLTPNHPTASGLTATESGKTVSLSWSAPDLTKAAPDASLEDFEKYPSFTTKLDGGWTMIDVDEAFVVGLKSIEMPVAGTQQAWWTMQCTGDFSFLPSIGKSVLAQMAVVDKGGRPVQNDDWLVSPKLYGGRQIVSFMACSANTAYGFDTFEVYYSTSGNTLEDFELLKSETAIDEEWTEYMISLPEGTQYFAIRCTSNDRFMMLLDDISFTAPGTPGTLKLQGYNVYRNDVKLNAQPVTTLSYTTSRDREGDDYYVTAVYDKGESAASNIVRLGTTAIDDITADTDASAPVEYYDLRGIRVDGNYLAPGIYVRRQGSQVSKIIVR